MDGSIVIPMRDEEEALPALEATVEAFAAARPPARPQVVLIDDGSRDRTRELARAWQRRSALEIDLVALDENRGLGGALRAGLPAATRPVVITYDADRAYPLDDVDRLVAALERGHDVATATPYTAGGRVEDVPFARLVPSLGVNALYRLRFAANGRAPGVFTCGFRAWDRELLARLPSRREGFLVTAELMVLALAAGARVAEVPSVLRRRTEGRSKMRVLRTAAAHLGLLARGR